MSELTKRQLQVAKMLAVGQSNKQIFMDLGITENTFLEHWKAIKRALGVRCRVQLTHLMLSRGQVQNLYAK